jgi:oligosaccharyltransferase complex subunit delta (ribophorin II)
VSHATFVSSVIALEGLFFLYYSGTKLLTILPFISVVGVVTFLSGIKALGEVQRRRLAGDR